jgi:MFS family permease
MVNFGDALKKGLVFCVEPKRWLPLLVLDMAVLCVVIITLLSGMNGIISRAVQSQGDPLALMGIAGLIIGFILLGVAWYLVRIWIIGSLIHQSFRPREIRKGYLLSLSRLHKIVGVTILVAIISGLVGAIPLVGWLLSIFLGWIFFFMLQGVILDDLGIVSTLKNSWRIFRKSMFDVFIAWLLITIISMAIFGLFSIPLMTIFFGMFFNSVITGAVNDPGFLALASLYLQTNLALIVAYGTIALVGLELSQVFAAKAQTEFYLQLRKKYPSIFKAFKDKIGRFF